MIGSLLIRGMLVGILAGLLAFGFAKIFGEPQVDRAIAFEVQSDKAKASAQMGEMDMSKGMTNAEAAEPALVSRNVQSSIGLMTATVVYGAAFGGLFALVFAFAYGRVGGLGPRGTALAIAMAGFAAIYLVPNLKYPANPPAVGLSETIGYRTALFFAMIVCSIAAMVIAVKLRQQLVARYGSWNAGIFAAAAFVVLVGVAATVLPGFNEVPETFPAVVLWNFRMAALGMQVVMWTVLGLLYGALAEALLRSRSLARPAHG